MKTLIINVIFALLLVLPARAELSYPIRLTWDENNPKPDGYRIFMRENAPSSYNYGNPAWEGALPPATITVSGNSGWCFVARAFLGESESLDSDEVCWPINADSDYKPLNTETLGFKIRSFLFLPPLAADSPVKFETFTMPDGSVIYRIVPKESP